MRSGLALLIIVAGTIAAQDRPLSVCEVLKDREALDQKIIAIRDIEIDTSEGGWLKGSGCGDSIVIGGASWPVTIWISTSRMNIESAGFRAADYVASVNRVKQELATQGYNRRTDKLRVTYIGLFVTVQEPGPRNKPPTGYGHQSAAPATLVVKEVRDPSIERPTGGNTHPADSNR